ncbi:MAG: Mrp/NBP35 family ATP-binding protein [Hyphomonadaceae bacterium]|nr:Mrp/NBP35 family ATP-binding protein [Hyphomonadaceae bacterium]MBC6411581.1 Mrp/NBP35 family ATP-binding protein [Hyphomonadaceae bacterium]
MNYSEREALDALSGISDPVTGRDIVTSGRLVDLRFENGRIRAVLQVDPARASDYMAVRKNIEAVLSDLDGVDSASVILTAHTAAPDMGRRRQQNPHKARRPAGYQGDALVDCIIAVSSAKGGVGKSTIAVNLAVALAKQGRSAGLLDADIHGPSAPILLGLEDKRAATTEIEGRRLIKPFEAHGIRAMSIGFLTDDDGPVVWRGPMVQGAISRMLWDTHWGQLDILIIDMPPGTGDPQLGLAQDIKPHGAVIVSTPQDLALADARKGVGMFGKVHIPVLGLVENMSIFICPDCGNAHEIFGADGVRAEAEKLNVPLLGRAPLHVSIRESCDTGRPVAGQDVPEAQSFLSMAEHLVALLK